MAQEERQKPVQVGPYKIESFIASGGMNDLYLATHQETLEVVVVKILKKKYLDQFEMKSRFMHEAEILAQSDHPGIVKSYGHGLWEGGLYQALEYVPGISLRKYIQNTPLTLKRAVEVTLDLCYAICHLHIQGIIHRDLKPENILVSDLGEVKIIDLGIARRIHELSQKQVSEEGRLIGTPSYMSPEQKENPEKVSFASDIYSLGIIAYELILGRLSHGHVHIGMLPKALQKIIGKALKADLKERYQDLVDVIGDFSNYLNVLIETEDESPLPLAVDALQSAVLELVPKTLPKWDQVEVDFSLHKGVGIAPIYYDFFTQNELYFILSQPIHPSSKGAIEMAYFRGLERAFRPQIGDLDTWSDLLIKTLLKDPLHPLYSVGLLKINQKLRKFEFIGIGEVRLYQISRAEVKMFASGSPPLGFSEMITKIFTGSLLEDDLLVVCTSDLVDASFGSAQLIQELKTYKKPTEYLIRKTKALYPQEFDRKSILIVSFTTNNL